MNAPAAPPTPTELFDLPHHRMVEVLASGAPVFVTVNPVEYHGPHLSLHNDRLLSLGLCADLFAGLTSESQEWPFLLAADLEIGVDPAPGRGSRHATTVQTARVVREACRALAEAGAQRVVLMTFHGAPLHNAAIESGVRLLRRAGVRAIAPMNLLLREMITIDAEDHAEAFAAIEDEAQRREMMRGIRFDFHAGFFETSLALHYAPDTVSPCHRELPDCPPFRRSRGLGFAARCAAAVGARALARELDFASQAYGWPALRPFPGYTGAPRFANAAAGAYFARSIVDQYLPRVQAVFAGDEESPRPVMRWVHTLSLGGRIGNSKIPLDDVAIPGTSA